MSSARCCTVEIVAVVVGIAATAVHVAVVVVAECTRPRDKPMAVDWRSPSLKHPERWREKKKKRKKKKRKKKAQRKREGSDQTGLNCKHDS